MEEDEVLSVDCSEKTNYNEDDSLQGEMMYHAKLETKQEVTKTDVSEDEVAEIKIYAVCCLLAAAIQIYYLDF